MGNVFYFEINSIGGDISVLEMILAESGDQVCLPYPTVPDYDYFDRVGMSVFLPYIFWNIICTDLIFLLFYSEFSWVLEQFNLLLSSSIEE